MFVVPFGDGLEDSGKERKRMYFVGAQKTGKAYRARFRLEDGKHRFSKRKFTTMSEALQWGTRMMRYVRAWRVA